MSIVIRRYIPWMIMVALTFITAMDTLVLQPTINNLAADIRKAQAIIGTFAAIISVTLLTRIHARRIQREPKRIESWVLLICLWVPLVWGLARYAFQGIKPSVEPSITQVFNAIVAPGDSTIYSILVFFIASAAYRAFRARSVEATVLLLAGIIAMLGNAPIGELIWPGFVPLKDWVNNVWVRAEARVIIISGLLATLALYVRMLLGYERGWMGRGE
ncbi:MAG: hypothetical protein QXR39_07460 [Candidatus Methanomethylicia archaeon]